MYDRKPHLFTQRDAARVLRHALNLGSPDEIGQDMEGFAQYACLSVISWMVRYDFFPDTALTEEEVLNQAGMFGDSVARICADYFKIDTRLVEVAERISSWFLGAIGMNPYTKVFRLKPFWAEQIAETVLNTSRLRKEDIYAR